MLLAFLGGAGIAALIAVVAVVASSGGNDGGGSKNLLAQAASATPTQAATPTQTPSPTPVPTQPPPPPPTPPPPPPEPTPRTCAEIRADPNYRTDAERDFFIRNCGTTAAAPTARPGAPPPPPPPPPAAGLTAEETTYLSRASVVMGQYIARLAQYWHTPSFGAYADLYELASIALNHANALNALAPVPSRYRASHDRLVQSLLSFRDHILTVRNIGSLQQFVVWLATYDRLADELDQSLKAYSTNTGIPIQNLGGLR